MAKVFPVYKECFILLLFFFNTMITSYFLHLPGILLLRNWLSVVELENFYAWFIYFLFSVSFTHQWLLVRNLRVVLVKLNFNSNIWSSCTLIFVPSKYGKFPVILFEWTICPSNILKFLNSDYLNMHSSHSNSQLQKVIFLSFPFRAPYFCLCCLSSTLLWFFQYYFLNLLTVFISSRMPALSLKFLFLHVHSVKHVTLLDISRTVSLFY